MNRVSWKNFCGALPSSDHVGGISSSELEVTLNLLDIVSNITRLKKILVLWADQLSKPFGRNLCALSFTVGIMALYCNVQNIVLRFLLAFT